MKRSVASMVYRPNSRWTWSFFLITLGQLIIGLALEGWVFSRYTGQVVPAAYSRQSSGNGNYARAIPTLLSLLIFAFIYELLLVYDALRSQNTIQIIGLVIMNIGILIYTGIQKSQIHDAVLQMSRDNFISFNYYNEVDPYLTAIPCIVALGTVLLAFVAWKLYGEFGWNIYKQIGADRRLRNRFFVYQIYIALLKFDFFLFVGFEVQFLVLVGNTSDAEKWLTVAAIPVSVILLLFAAWCTQQENLIGMVVTFAVYLAMVAYFVDKLVRMYSSERSSDYRPARKTLTVFAVITLILIVITMGIAVWCTLNFNKGLKPHLTSSRKSPSNNIGGGSGEDELVSGGKSKYELDYTASAQAGGAQGYGGSGVGGGQSNSSRPYGGSRMEID